MRDSAAELYKDTLAYLKTRPLTMRYIELMQTGDNAALYQRAHISAAHITARLLADGWQERERSPLAGPAREYHHPDYAGRIGITSPPTKKPSAPHATACALPLTDKCTSAYSTASTTTCARGCVPATSRDWSRNCTNSSPTNPNATTCTNKTPASCATSRR